ncbi:hypothetical protein wcw_1807 [Waddlia chondrophila WSU 86-1044]|uniref:Uncharacterized protein n=1 Tax=Waddlia chondrophila (strain ATCC VR-1470 / WSU 86-1044) TaxID=716544 RepID=D6YSV1_WADCW|nr:hypothetical protein wcw_1807 [Waddlia chondrophila WSU 86-1044]
MKLDLIMGQGQYIHPVSFKKMTLKSFKEKKQ